MQQESREEGSSPAHAGLHAACTHAWSRCDPHKLLHLRLPICADPLISPGPLPAEEKAEKEKREKEMQRKRERENTENGGVKKLKAKKPLRIRRGVVLKVGGAAGVRSLQLGGARGT